jgi:hypothetical protein
MLFRWFLSVGGRTFCIGFGEVRMDFWGSGSDERLVVKRELPVFSGSSGILPIILSIYGEN